MRWDAKTWSFRLLSSCLALQGCASSGSEQAGSTQQDQKQLPADGPAVFVGEVEDSDVQVAVVADGARARVYFCGGPDSVATATHWFNLARSGDALDAQDQGFELRASFEDDRVTGEYKPAGEAANALQFTGTRVDRETLAGLYEGVDECGRLGVIVRQSDRDAEPSAQGACVQSGQPPEQVNPITPLALEDGKLRVEAPSRDAELQLPRAGLSPL